MSRAIHASVSVLCGVCLLTAAAELKKAVYHIRLRATDRGGLAVEQGYGVGLR